MAEDRQILTRIVALLNALAGLAERASAAHLPVLCLVFMVLRPAEAIARHFLADLSRSATSLDDPAPCALDDSAPSDARAEALRIALVFRMLAFALNGLAAAGAPPCCLSGFCRRAARDLFAALGNLAWPRPEAADTS